MKYFTIALIASGGIGFLSSLLSSALGISLICLAAVAIGIIAIWNNIQQKFLRRKISFIVSLFLVFLIFSYGCTIKVPMKPDCQNIEFKEKLPVEAGLLITKESQEYVFKGKPESFTGGARPHEFPLGKTLATASEIIFLELFKDVTLVESFEEAQKYKLIVNPEIEDFHFRYDQLSYGGFAVSVLSRIKVTVMLFSGESKLWEKTVESPDVRKGPWMFNVSYEKEVGESASEALVSTLKQIASEIAEDETLRDYILEQ